MLETGDNLHSFAGGEYEHLNDCEISIFLQDYSDYYNTERFKEKFNIKYPEEISKERVKSLFFYRCSYLCADFLGAKNTLERFSSGGAVPAEPRHKTLISKKLYLLLVLRTLSNPFFLLRRHFIEKGGDGCVYTWARLPTSFFTRSRIIVFAVGF